MVSMKKMIKEFTPEEKSEYNKQHKKSDYQKHRQARLDYQASYYQKHKEEIKKRENNRYRIKCELSPILQIPEDWKVSNILNKGRCSRCIASEQKRKIIKSEVILGVEVSESRNWK